eukprot:TRINITY_DN4961_c0_g1_i1.p3 TRINITY_DN4961_c0_g1~~TRINITY_DN4961_c0_g1_i1.p3  ORF type:complete len:127 (+),score=29.92 TRINITY_DN4961_c0_g1_i1:1302-1682(+)
MVKDVLREPLRLSLEDGVVVGEAVLVTELLEDALLLKVQEPETVKVGEAVFVALKDVDAEDEGEWVVVPEEDTVNESDPLDVRLVVSEEDEDNVSVQEQLNDGEKDTVALGDADSELEGEVDKEEE